MRSYWRFSMTPRVSSDFTDCIFSSSIKSTNICLNYLCIIVCTSIMLSVSALLLLISYSFSMSILSAFMIKRRFRLALMSPVNISPGGLYTLCFIFSLLNFLSILCSISAMYVLWTSFMWLSWFCVDISRLVSIVLVSIVWVWLFFNNSFLNSYNLTLLAF